MAQTALDTSSASLYTILFHFTWGDSHVARYARYDSSVTVAGNVYLPDPTIVVKAQSQQGTVKDDPWDIWMSRLLEPMNTYARVFPHAPVKITISEIVPGNDATLRTLFRGQLTGFVLNPDGKPDRVKCRVLSAKSLYRLPLGLPATTTCGWIFGDQQCQKDVPAITLTGEITNLSQSGKATWIASDLTDSPSGVLDNDRWRRGYILYDGLTLMIRKSFVNGVFALVDQPPPEWLNTGSGTMAFVPGCDGLLGTCRNTHDNEQFFGGVGIAIPNRNPIIGEPDNDDQTL